MLINCLISVAIGFSYVHADEEIKINNLNAYGAFKSLKIEYVYFSHKKDNFFDSTKGSISFEEDTLILRCHGLDLITDAIPPFNVTASASLVMIDGCNLPATPLVELFETLNVNTTAIEALKLRSSGMDQLPPGNYTPGLNIKILAIESLYVNARNFLIHNPDFFEPLKKLTVLSLEGTRLLPLPKWMRLEVLSVSHDAIIETWDWNCEYLRELSFFDISDIPEVWPERCSQLTSLKLRRVAPGAVDRVLTSGINASCVHLRSLYIQDCRQLELPLEMLNVAKELLYLNMSVNFMDDKALSSFPLMRNLTHLDLQRNQLTGWALFDLVKQLPSLRYLNLDGNRFVNLFCNFENRISSFTAHLLSLEWLSLRAMPTDLKCLKSLSFSKLRYLDLYLEEDVDYFSMDMPRTNATHFVIDLRGRNVKNVMIKYYDEIREGVLWGSTNVTILLTSIDCDCNNEWFARAIRDQLFSSPGLVCKNSGVEIIHEELDNMVSEKLTRRGCILRYWSSNATAKADCHGTKIRDQMYPEYNLHHMQTISLNASGDEITSLRDMKLTDWLEVLDLRNNQIARLDANDSTRLFALPERQVWLSGNKIICDCDNKPLLDALHQHRHQVVDFDDVTCFDTGMPLSSVTSYEACQVGLRILLGVGSIFACLMLVAAVLLWRNRLRLKIYLFSRGLCLSCLREEDVDVDKPYDAFLSFAHQDFEFVSKELLPRLESEPNLFRVCVHYRDWVVGNWIPDQIMRSVSLSKRTIILLSRNFVASMWASLEFRYAMASATKEGRSRILVLILDDVLSESLDAEMQEYLNYNTYLKCDDPWFWDKLLYVMPHRKQLAKTNSRVANPAVREEILLPQIDR